MGSSENVKIGRGSFVMSSLFA